MAGRGVSLEAQVKQLAGEIRALHTDLSRITEQREAIDEVNLQKQREYDELAAKHKEISHKLRVTNEEFHELEAELERLDSEEVEPVVQDLDKAVSSVVRRSVEAVREKRQKEFSLQLAMLKLEATGAAKRIGDASGGASDMRLLDTVGVQYGNFTCIMNLPANATFEDVVVEACEYWGIGANGVFLQGPDGAIYPQSAVVATSVPLEYVQAAQQRRSAGAEAEESKRRGESKRGDLPESSMAPRSDAKSLVSVHGPGESAPAGVVMFKLRRPRMAVERSRLTEIESQRRKQAQKKQERARSKRDKLQENARLRREQQDSRRVELRQSAVVRELTIHTVFAILFIVLLLTKRSVTDSFFLSSTARSALVEREFVSEADAAPDLDDALVSYAETDPKTTQFVVQAFRTVATPAGFWRWVEGPLTNTIFPDPAFNKTGPILTYNRLVGSVRLRQLRVKANAECELSDRAKGFVSECYPMYSESARSTAPFNDLVSPGFTYTPPEQLLRDRGTPKYEGQLAEYDASGFAVDLSGERDAWLTRVAALRSGAWLDSQTRAVFVTFNLYNANLDLYLSSTLLFEQSLAGNMVTSFAFDTIRLNTCVLCTWFAVLENLLHLFIFYMTLLIIVNLKATVRFKGSVVPYFTDPWNLVDVGLLVTYITAGSLRLSLLFQNVELEATLWSPSSTYSDLSTAAFRYQLAFRMDSIVVFLSLVKMFKFLRLIRRMRQFIQVFVQASVEIIFFAALFFGTFMGFVVLAHEIYGTEMAEYADIVRSVRTLLKMMVGDFDYERMRQVDGTWTPLFFFLFVAFVVLVMVNVFLAILNETYTTVRMELTEEEERLRKLRSMRPQQLRTMASTIHFLKETFHPRSLLSTDLMRISEEEEVEAEVEAGGGEEGAGDKSASSEAKKTMGSSNPFLA